jgi:ABC-type uncharacterized transport system permease subunit
MSAMPAGARHHPAAWAASDHWEMAKRSLRHIRHDPEQLANVTLQPVLIVALMNFVFGGAIKTGTHGSYLNFVMPGIFVVAAAFAAVTTTTSVAADTPAWRPPSSSPRSLSSRSSSAARLSPTATMPSWLRAVTANQPVTQAIDTLRALLAGRPPGSHLWLTLAEFAAIIAVAFTVAAALFRRVATA